MRACLIKHKVTTAQAAQAHKVLYKPRTKQEGTGVEQAPASLVRTEPPSFRSTEQNAITKVNSSSNLVPRLLTDWEVERSLFFIARNYLAVRGKKKNNNKNPKHFFLHREQSTSSKVTLAFLFVLYSNSLISMTLTQRTLLKKYRQETE